jgi:hypothetical protein
VADRSQRDGIVLRHQLQKLIDRVNVTKIDAWGLKADFEKDLSKAESLSPPPMDTPKIGVHLAEGRQTIGEIIASGERIMVDMGNRMMPTPDTAILERWESFERQLFEAAGYGDPKESSNRFRRTHRILWDFGLSDNDREAYTLLYDMKERVANSYVPIATWNDVSRLIGVMSGIIQRVEEFRKAHPPASTP